MDNAGTYKYSVLFKTNMTESANIFQIVYIYYQKRKSISATRSFMDISRVVGYIAVLTEISLGYRCDASM